MKFFMWLGVGIFTVPLRGFVLQTLWRWFIVPLGVITLTLPQAVGLCVIMEFFTARVNLKKDTPEEETKKVILAFLTPLWFWAVGWIVQMFL